MLTLRAATMDDAADLFAWRNDPVTRAMSLCSEPVEWEDHLAWLENSIAREDRELFVGVFDNEAVGTVRLDHDGPEPEMSITMAPEWRGFRVSRALVEAATPPSGCMARIKRENLGAQRLIASAGFELTRSGPLLFWRHPGHRVGRSAIADR